MVNKSIAHSRWKALHSDEQGKVYDPKVYPFMWFENGFWVSLWGAFIHNSIIVSSQIQKVIIVHVKIDCILKLLACYNDS